MSEKKHEPITIEGARYRQYYLDYIEGQLSEREISYINTAIDKDKIYEASGETGVVYSPVNKTMQVIRAKLCERLGYYLSVKIEVKKGPVLNFSLPDTQAASHSFKETPINADSENVAANIYYINNIPSKKEEQNSKKSPFQKISEMNSEAITSRETMGGITPPIRACFIKALRVPTPHGYRDLKPDNKSLGADASELPSLKNSSAMPDDIRINYPLAKTDDAFAVPSKFKMIACENGNADEDEDEQEGHLIVRPTEKNTPFVHYNADYIADNQADYIIRKRNETPVYNCIKPDENERAYWSQTLPLPKELKNLCEANPNYATSLIATYVTENFRYACHDRLGEFIQKNSEDLPLIIDELRVGHCDLLSWVSAAYMRGLGHCAYVTGDLVTNFEGDSFMKKYGHARVVIIDENGRECFFDPAAKVEPAYEFATELLKDEVIENMEAAYAKAENEERKRQIISGFMNHTQSLAKNISAKQITGMQRILRFISSLSGNADNNTIEPLDHISMQNRSKQFKDNTAVENFHLTGNPNLENFLSLAESLSSNFGLFERFTFSGQNPAQRKQLQDFLNYYRLFRLPIDRMVDSDRYNVELLLKNTFFSTIFFSDGEIFQCTFCNGTNRACSFDPNFAARIGNIKSAADPINIADLKIVDLKPSKIVDVPSKFKPRTLIFGENYITSMLLIDKAEIAEFCEYFSPDFDFSDRFKSIAAQIEWEDILISLQKMKIIKKNRRISLHFDDYSLLIELFVFQSLAAKALANTKLREKMKSDFALSDSYFDKLATNILPLADTQGKGLLKSVYNLEFNRDLQEKGHLTSKILRTDGADKKRARHGFEQLIKKLDRRPKKGRREFHADGWRLEKYAPENHDAKDICWAKTATNPYEPVVKTHSPEIMRSQPLHVLVYLNNPLYEYYLLASLETLIENLQALAKKGRNIYLTTNQIENYVPLKNVKMPAREIAMRLSQLHLNMTTAQNERNFVANNGLLCRGKMPENLLFISDTNTIVNSASWQLQNKCNLVATTFRDANIDMYYLIKDEWVEHGD